MSARPFRFGFMAGGTLFKTPPSRAQWIETVRRIEGLGLDTLLVPNGIDLSTEDRALRRPL